LCSFKYQWYQRRKQSVRISFFLVEIFVNYDLLFRLPRLSIVKTKLGAYKPNLTPYCIPGNDNELQESMSHFLPDTLSSYFSIIRYQWKRNNVGKRSKRFFQTI
jgi:hypothetical protein